MAAVLFMGVMNILVLNWILPVCCRRDNKNNVMERCYQYKLSLFYAVDLLLSSSFLDLCC